MSVILVSQSDINGGAARAAYRLHRALLEHGITSRMKVRTKQSDDWTVDGPVGIWAKANSLLRFTLGGIVLRLQNSNNANVHSGNVVPSAWAGELNASTAKVVNLHWVAGETLSIEDIGRIRKPLVWTLPDMWPLCGAEHYGLDDETARWRVGYSRANRPATDRGLDLNHLIWQRKRRAWRRPMHIVAPSRWLADCARESPLFYNWPVSVIPCLLDTDVYQPLDQACCRDALGLPDDRRIILFGALGGGRDSRKGYDLLREALGRLAAMTGAKDLFCVVFGQSAPQHPPPMSFSTRWMGHLHDDPALVLLYNAADVMVVPSRQEAFGQTASEAQACGKPVVAFDSTGLKDVVAHRETGYLARSFDPEDMAKGLLWILDDADNRAALGRAARERALRLWSPAVVVPQYLKVFEAAIVSQPV